MAFANGKVPQRHCLPSSASWFTFSYLKKYCHTYLSASRFTLLLLEPNTTFSQANYTPECNLDEEVDIYPFSKPPKIVSLRYDRLKRVVGAVQTTVGQVLDLVEIVFLLLSWRDRRATALFLLFCLIAGVSLFLFTLASQYMYSRYMYHVTPFQMFQILAALYLMRPPRFRRQELPWVINFLWRLPARHDDLLF